MNSEQYKYDQIKFNKVHYDKTKKCFHNNINDEHCNNQFICKHYSIYNICSNPFKCEKYTHWQ